MEINLVEKVGAETKVAEVVRGPKVRSGFWGKRGKGEEGKGSYGCHETRE